MTATEVVVLVHALIGILFIAGLIGRWIVLGAAARAVDLPSMRTLAAAAGPFERIVIAGSTLVLVFGVVAAFMEGRSVIGPLNGGSVDWLFVSVLLYLSIIPLVPFVFLPRGKVFESALAEAEVEHRVTPQLQAVWRDPVVRAAHLYELTAVTIVLILMLSKPF
jgi:Predicted integral membrane protein (DUF2269)